MNTQDYQKSIKYIENYYNQQRAHRENFADSDEQEGDAMAIHNSSDGDSDHDL